MNNFKYLNDNLVNNDQAFISSDQRGFLYGDGVFESCKIYQGQILDFDRHLNRLFKALEYLGIDFFDNNLFQKCQELITKNNCDNAILKISVSRGIGSHGYLPYENCQSLLIIETKPYHPINQVINLGVSYRNPNGFFFKSLSSLPYVLTKIEAKKQDCYDNIIVNDQGLICETATANIFWVKNDKIYTNDDNCGMVLGCMRQKIIEENFFNVNKTTAKITDLLDAQEVFLTNSIHGIIAVNSIKKDHFVKKYQNNLVTELKKLIINYC
jgi:branched-chain amino acid aminotransferase